MDGHSANYTEKPKSSSNRSFGFVFSVFFLIVALLPLASGHNPRLWAVVVSLAFAAIALVWPVALAPFNRVWTQIGSLLHKVVSPISLGILFFGVVTPTAFFMRIFGKDSLRLKLDKNATTYWIERAPPGPAPESFKNQF